MAKGENSGMRREDDPELGPEDHHFIKGRWKEMSHKKEKRRSQQEGRGKRE